MYSIFRSNHKRNRHLEEGEPPPKKLIKEEDVLIKNLSEKQLKTSTTLSEQLVDKKEFLVSEHFTDFTNQVNGELDLQNFIAHIESINKWNSLSNKTLSKRDIEMYTEYQTCCEKFWSKYKSINRDILQQYIKRIEEILLQCDDKRKSIDINCLDAQNKSQITLSDPMDEVAKFEKQLSTEIEQYSYCNIKKIRKKARSLSNQIKTLEVAVSNSGTVEKQHNKLKPLTTNSLWDIKDITEQIVKTKIVETKKTFSCQPRNLYTIKEGKIVQLNGEKNYFDLNKLTRMSVDEIKKIPKFSQYKIGEPSTSLYVKNFARSIRQDQFKQLLDGSIENDFSIKLLNGKLRGQAFIQFKDHIQAEKALNILNGIMLTSGKPLIVQYAKESKYSNVNL